MRTISHPSSDSFGRTLRNSVLLLCAGTVATKNGYGVQFAVCAEQPMAEGVHYVEMTLLKQGRYYDAQMGVVGQGFGGAGV
eukprot:COSAG06_NODE_38525_length_422_cov_1.393189_1_plen_80_part_01